MRTTKKRDIGVGDNLYGIPIKDILSPEQLDSMKQNPPSSRRRKLRAERKRREKEKRSLKNLKLPRIDLPEKTVYIITVVVAVLILVFVFKNSFASRVMPKLYVAEAMEESVSMVKKEFKKTIKGIFGFDIFDSRQMTLSANGGIGADSSGVLSNLSMNIQAGYSKKDKNLSAVWQYLHNGEEFASAVAYLNDEEVGFNMPQLFAEYWVSPSETFGKKWNESGLRQAMYAEPIGENADFSFSNIFENSNILSEDGMKKISQLTEALFKTSHAEYTGKSEILANGESRLARSFCFDFNSKSINEYLLSVMKLISEDEESSKLISHMGKTKSLHTYFEDLTGRLSDSIDIETVTLRFSEYKGAVRNNELQVVYTENGNKYNIGAAVSAENLKNIVDGVRAEFDFANGERSISYTLNSVGNHTCSGDEFTDNTTIDVAVNDYTYSFGSEVEIDLKEGKVNGKVTGEDRYSSKTLSFSGDCVSKKGIELAFNDMWATVTGALPRNLTGNVRIKLEPALTVPKLNVSNKKMILDYTKAEAESYITRLEETDNVKGFLDTINSIFRKPE